jgi:hypothetical protein
MSDVLTIAPFVIEPPLPRREDICMVCGPLVPLSALERSEIRILEHWKKEAAA